MPELMIFKAGNYPQGEWSKERVQKMVDAYDPVKNIEAPIVIGHKYYSQSDSDQYAHGWVTKLRMDGAGKVFATIDEFSADVKKAMAEKKLRYISAEFWEYDKRNEGESPYLKAIALLGRDTPAVQGAKLPTMFDRSGGVMSTLDEKEYIAAFTRKVSGEDKTAFSSTELESTSLTMPSTFGKSGAETQTVHKEASMDEEKLKTLEAENAAMKTQLATFQKENEGLRDERLKADALTYFGKLRDEGKLPPAQFDCVVALDTKLGEEQRKELRTMFGEMGQVVDLSEKRTGSTTPVLSDRGTLKRSIIFDAFPDGSVIIGSNLVYARIHQESGKTSPHTIKPRNAKALSFLGIYRKLVHHPGSDIPARPFFGVPKDFERDFFDDPAIKDALGMAGAD